MKKVTLGMLFLLMMFLVACGQSESAEDIYEKALAAGEEMESAELDMEIKQTISSEEVNEEVGMDIATKAEMVLDPLAMHQLVTVSFALGDFPMETEMEMYMTDSDIYMHESMTDTWMKSDASMIPANLMDVEQNPQEQLKMLESFIDDVEFLEEEDYYVFKYDGDGEELIELTQELIQENLDENTLSELGLDINEMLEDMTVHSVFYEMQIEKDTYYTKGVTVNMDFEIQEGDDTLQMKQETNATYTGINTIDSIEIPQEVIDQAEEF
jgi:hypothetical protein